MPISNDPPRLGPQLPNVAPPDAQPAAQPAAAPDAGRARPAPGLDRAADLAPNLAPPVLPDAAAPASPDAVRAGIPGLARVDLENRLRANRPGALDLVPGRFPDAVGLDVILARLANDPRGAGALKKLVGELEARTGVKVPPALMNAVVANPTRLADLFAVTPKQLSEGFDAIAAGYRAGVVHDAKPKARVLPQGFDLAGLANAPIEAPKYALKELVPGLYQGDVRSELPDAQAKANIAAAEVFDRLAENGSKPAKERFHVRLDGHDYTRLDSLLHALEKSGHQISVNFGHRIANFADLKTKAPDGTVLDVPAALLIRTGVVDANGEEAVLPAAHAELNISVKSTAAVKGTKVDADLRFFQGMDATGFFADGVAKLPAWLGYVRSDALAGKEAVKAIDLAGLMSDAINTVAREANLPFGAYGVTGVCMDSVAVVRHAMTGHTGYYPLLMRDSVVLPLVDRRLADHDRRDDVDLRRLRASIAAVPSDVGPDPTARARMAGSIPWPEGQEPFASVSSARRILAEAP